VAKKFAEGDPVDDSVFYYCPLIDAVLKNSEVVSVLPYDLEKPLPAEPISAILSGNWDDEYLFKFQKISAVLNIRGVCRIVRHLLSDQFVGTEAERKFLGMWFLSMFECMEAERLSGREVYLEEADFDQQESKLCSFILPIPQVWVRVIPPAPSGVSWSNWVRRQHEAMQPQRVDFLLTYEGKRHIIELDGSSHYRTEADYRKTLTSTRWLRMCGYEVHRFTNQEILELSDFSSPSGWPDVTGFVKLLQMEGLESSKMVFL
jgi:hypothetical protein